MTHMKPMAESEGTFEAEKRQSDRKCDKCHSSKVTYRVWESSCGGYEDYKYTCGECGHWWWIDGIDS